MPAEQFWQVALLLAPTVSDHVPGAHCVNADALVAPGSSQKPPAPQNSHAVLFLVVEKRPAAHGSQLSEGSFVEDAFARYLPVSHWRQLASAALTKGE